MEPVTYILFLLEILVFPGIASTPLSWDWTRCEREIRVNKRDGNREGIKN